MPTNCYQFWIETMMKMEIREEQGMAQNEGFGWILKSSRTGNGKSRRRV